MNTSKFYQLLSRFINKPLGVLGLDANGDAVGQFVPRTGPLADQKLLAGSPGEVGTASDTAALILFNGVAGQAQVAFPTPGGLRAAVVPTIPGFIGTNTTMTIGSGKNFADMTAFKTFIEQCVVDESATITLSFDRGYWAWDGPSTGRTWPRIVLTSTGVYSYTGVSISATGAAGAWTLTLTKTGLADSILGVGGANQPNLAVCITDGTAGTNPDNAVAVYTGVTKVDANTITLSSASALTAMPSGVATCNLYAPNVTLSSLDALGAYRSIQIGNSGSGSPVGLQAMGLVPIGTKIKTPLALLCGQDISVTGVDFDLPTIYTSSLAPVNCRFIQSILTVVANDLQPLNTDVGSVSGFLVDNGWGTPASIILDNSILSFSGTIINTLADGQLEASRGGVLQVTGTTINGTAVTAANLANYTSLTPGFMSDDGGLIYFAGTNKLTNPYSNVTASRALNTNYANSGRRSLLVTVSARCAITAAAGSATIQGFSDTAATPTTAAGPLVGVQAGLLNEDNTVSTTFVVAPGANYRVNSVVANGTATLGTWWELAL